MSLKDLYDTQVDTPGLRWRLKFLNQSLGSLRKGDFGFIFARPETGKTTFLASEITHMATQTEGDILWFCNEEQGNKVGIRTFQAALGVQTDTLWNDIDRHQKIYDHKVGNRIKIFHFEDSSNANRIEQILKQHKPALIIFDQLDKVKGFKAERKDLELAAGYQWAREIAKQYAPVIGVSQASGEAEGKLWLSMDMIDGSKTGKAAEADWIVGIGKDSDNTSRSRYLAICKNKLIGDKDTLPDLRHGSSQVLIRPEVARYEDIG
jgi:replicative DNA helicase